MNEHSHSSCCGHSHSGKNKALSHWIALRIFSVLLLPLVAWVVYSVIALKGADYGAFLGWFANPVHAFVLGIFLLVSCYHAALGVQEIIEDYIACEKSAKCAIVAEKFLFAGIALAGISSIIMISLTIRGF